MRNCIYKIILASVFLWSQGSFAEDAAPADEKALTVFQCTGIMEAITKTPTLTTKIEAADGDVDGAAEEFEAISAEQKKMNDNLAEAHKAYLATLKDARKPLCAAQEMIHDQEETTKGNKLTKAVKGMKYSITQKLDMVGKQVDKSIGSTESGHKEFAKVYITEGEKPEAGGEGETASGNTFTFCKITGSYDTYYQTADELHQECVSAFGKIQESYVGLITQANDYAHQMGSTKRKLLAAGIGIGAAGVGYKVYSDKKKKKKRKKTAAKLAEEMKNGIITLEDGSKKKCFTTTTYTDENCRDTLKRLCQDSENANKGGCQAFNGFYCGGGTGNENSGYCNFAEAVGYCSSPGDVIQQSPACQWKSSRPASCLNSPNDLQCLSKMSASQLTTACKDFPHDPLCKKAAAGMIVSQPGGAVVAAQPVEGSSSTLSSIAAGSGATSQSQSQVNLWDNNANTLQNLYGTGQLVGGQ